MGKEADPGGGTGAAENDHSTCSGCLGIILLIAIIAGIIAICSRPSNDDSTATPTRSATVRPSPSRTPTPATLAVRTASPRPSPTVTPAPTATPALVRDTAIARGASISQAGRIAIDVIERRAQDAFLRGEAAGVGYGQWGCLRRSPRCPLAPEHSTPIPTPTPGEYLVQAGDTLRSIAKQFGTTIDRLIEANDIEDTDVIRTGSILQIPAPATAAGEGSTTSPTASPVPTPTPVPTQTPIPTPTSTPAPIQISLAGLLQEYDQNKVRANIRLRYLENGKRLVSTSGYIDQIEELYSTITPTQDTYSVQELRCYYANTRSALHITKGQFVSVTGRISGPIEYTSGVQMYACEFEGIQFETNPIVPIAALRMNVVEVICYQETSVLGVVSVSQENRGTGVIMIAEDGTILTVHHVVADENECKRIAVVLPGIGGANPGRILKHCASIDIAVLHISPRATAGLSLQTIYWAAAPAQIDQEVFFWGYGPGRLRKETGIVREVWSDDIVIDAYAVPGDSGSPVFDENGHLLGIVSSGNRSDRTIVTGDLLDELRRCIR